MPNHYTMLAEKVLRMADNLRDRFGDDKMEPYHIAISTLDVGEGTVVNTLEIAGIDVRALREKFMKIRKKRD